MLWTALRRLRDEEDGFTLIELMVVVMILAILIVMGLPTFLGVKARFQDRAAQTDLRNTVLAARILLHGHRYVHERQRLAAAGLVTIVPNMCYVAERRTLSVANGTVACASGAGDGFDQRRVDRDAVRRSSHVLVHLLLRDPRRDDRDEVRRRPRRRELHGDWARRGNVTATTPAAAGW